MKIRKIIFPLLVFCALFGVSGCARIPVQDPLSRPQAGPLSREKAGDGLVVPGSRVGLYRLGDSISEAKNLLGEADNVDRNFSMGPSVSGVKYDYTGAVNLNFLADKENKITMIFVYNSEFHTREGIRIGSNFSEVEKRYGNALKSKTTQPGDFFADYTSGIAYLISAGKVQCMFVKSR
jgi:hypothetical protein